MSSRRVLKLLANGKFRVMSSRARTRTVIIGAYYFVGSTGRRDIGAVLRVTRCGGSKDYGILIIAKYVTRHCGGRVVRRMPRMSTMLNAASCRSVLGTVHRTVRKGRFRRFGSVSCLPRGLNGHILAANKRFKCLGVTRNYSGRYACYVVPGLHNGFQDIPVRHLMARTGRVTRRNMGRLVLITRRAAMCKASVCKGGSLRVLLGRLYGVGKVH